MTILAALTLDLPPVTPIEVTIPRHMILTWRDATGRKRELYLNAGDTLRIDPRHPLWPEIVKRKLLGEL